MQIELDDRKVKLKVTLSEEESHALQFAVTIIDGLCNKMYKEGFKEISIESPLINRSASFQEVCNVSPQLNLLLSAQDEDAEVYGIK